MRGKSVNTEFVAEFIQECCVKNKTSPKEITSEAKLRISQIDQEIRRAEELKLTRSRLMDVVNSFGDDEEEKDKPESFVVRTEVESEQAKLILSMIAELKSITIESIVARVGESNKTRAFLAIKQLSEMGVVVRDSSTKKFEAGPNFSQVAAHD